MIFETEHGDIVKLRRVIHETGYGVMHIGNQPLRILIGMLILMVSASSQISTV